MTQLGAVNPLPNTVLVTSLKQLIEFEKAMASLIHAFEASNLLGAAIVTKHREE